MKYALFRIPTAAMLLVCLCAALCFCATLCLAHSTLLADDREQAPPTTISSFPPRILSLEYLKDSTRSMSLRDVEAAALQEKFIRHPSSNFTFAASRAAYWLRCTAARGKGSEYEKQNWVLYVGDILIDSAMLCTPEPHGGFATSFSGEKMLFSSRAISTKVIAFPLELAGDSAQTFYLRVVAADGEFLKMRILPKEEFTAQVTQQQMIMLFLLGMMVFAMLYNSVLWAYSRDIRYFYYVLYVSGFFFTMLAVTFPAFEYFFPDTARIGYLARSSSTAVLSLMRIVFMRSFLSTATLTPRSDKILLASIFLAIVCLVAPLLGLEEYVWSVIMPLWYPITLIAWLVIAVVCWRLKQMPIRIYVTGYVLFLVMAIGAQFLHGWIDVAAIPMGLNQTVTSAAGAIEMVFFSFALAARLNQLQNDYVREQEQRLRAEQENEHERLRTIQAQSLAQQAELAALRYQINPHFLFNTLSSLRALVDEDTVRAQTMIGKLAEYLRYAVYPEHDIAPAPASNGEDFGMVTLGEEIAMLRNYFDIERIRFEEKLHVDYDIAPETETFRIPGFLLQPLAENALKYGMQTSPLPLRISISACVTHNTAATSILTIHIKNSGVLGISLSDEKQHREVSKHDVPTGGLGLTNVHERLHHIFGEKASLKLQQEGEFVVASIVLAEATAGFLSHPYA